MTLDLDGSRPTISQSTCTVAVTLSEHQLATTTTVVRFSATWAVASTAVWLPSGSSLRTAVGEQAVLFRTSVTGLESAHLVHFLVVYGVRVKKCGSDGWLVVVVVVVARVTS